MTPESAVDEIRELSLEDALPILWMVAFRIAELLDTTVEAVFEQSKIIQSESR